MFKSNRSHIACLITTVALAVGAATPAGAAPTPPQEGLVNVNVSGVRVQVPISVAANICDVNVNVLAQQIDSPSQCTANADSDAVSAGIEGPPPQQNGLVNVNISDVIVQLPITVAANVCDVNVNVLADQLDAPARCRADADSDARPQG
jgi:hypothetical protein